MMRDFDQNVINQQVPSGITGNAPAEPDEHWSMELEKRGKEAAGQIDFHQRELRRWQRMGRAVHAALAALHEPQNDPEQYDQAEGPNY
jgi:hypothetical protein